MLALPAIAQRDTARIESNDSVLVATGARYRASAAARFLLGETYRELWVTPIKVPVLDMSTFGGGVKPLKLGGGLQTLTLRLQGEDGREYVFRLADKSRVSTPPALKGTIVDRIFRDQVSALHPAGAMISAPILEAGGTLHPTAVFMFMPDDPLLGEFRADFGGKLGMVEEYPSVPADMPGFGGALEIIDSEDLLKLLNKDPMQRVDARAMLKARLIDILLSDNDRHAGQWKWARMNDRKPTYWVAIPRDRDHAFIHFDGRLIQFARAVSAPNLILFEGSNMNLAGLTEHRGFDGRVLAELDRQQWDSVATSLVRDISDSVIDAAVLMQPAEYRASGPQLAASIKDRRNRLQSTATDWYLSLAVAPDVHATDASDRAIVTRVDQRFVDVRLVSANGTEYFARRFDSRETEEVRVFLHGGDDSAIVTGNVRRSILVRLVGGNGNNSLRDSSSVNGAREPTRIYDQGEASGVSYGADTLFNRKQMVERNGKLNPPGQDRGIRWVPRIGYGSHSGLGATPALGVTRYDYGFEHHPYASRIDIEAEYATRFRGWRIGIEADRRTENSPLHLVSDAMMSDLELFTYRGLGNMLTREQARDTYYEARQRQWMLQSAVALSLNSGSDISLGPVVQYSTTDSVPNQFLSEVRPYGFGSFGQVGARLNLHVSMPLGLRPAIVRDRLWTVFPRPLHTVILDLDVTHYPALWDVKSPFDAVSARAGASLTLPLPTSPILVMRGGGMKLFGEFPFHDAAFIGGRNAIRAEGFQNFEGDASLFGSAELQIPLAKFLLVLPLQAGVLGLADAGRVFVNGSSPGGWHTVAGGGLWVGLPDSPVLMTFTLTNDGGRSRFSMRSGLKIH